MIYYILLIHWLADFVFQTRWQADNKYNNVLALTQHILGYTLCFFLAFTPFLGVTGSLYYAACNGVFHWIIDFNTSKLTHSLYEKKDYHNFFVVIGFDQFVHVSLLFYLYTRMLPR